MNNHRVGVPAAGRSRAGPADRRRHYPRFVHPIERLRYVARASGADQGPLVREAASALAHFRDDPQGLVTASRRVLARQPASGALWWLCARALYADDPMVEAWRVAEEIDEDPTARELAHALPDDATVCVLGWPELIGTALVRRGDLEVLVVDTLSEGSGLVARLLRADSDAVDVPLSGLGPAVADCDLVLLEASAVGPHELVGVAGSLAAAAVARASDVPVWVVAGAGRLLPERMWAALVRLLDRDEPWDRDDEIVPLDLVDRLAGPCGVEPVPDALRRVDCPVVPELLRALET
jgi:hypothetical protein